MAGVHATAKKTARYLQSNSLRHSQIGVKNTKAILNRLDEMPTDGFEASRI
jgi:hypothetical protein